VQDRIGEVLERRADRPLAVGLLRANLAIGQAVGGRRSAASVKRSTASGARSPGSSSTAAVYARACSGERDGGLLNTDMAAGAIVSASARRGNPAV
jgi:hypothetical protein